MVVGLPSAEKYTPGPDRRGAFRLSTLEIANPTEQFSFRFRLRPSTFLFLFLSSSISSTPAVRPLLLLHHHRPIFLFLVFFIIPRQSHRQFSITDHVNVSLAWLHDQCRRRLFWTSHRLPLLHYSILPTSAWVTMASVYDIARNTSSHLVVFQSSYSPATTAPIAAAFSNTTAAAAANCPLPSSYPFSSTQSPTSTPANAPTWTSYYRFAIPTTTD